MNETIDLGKFPLGKNNIAKETSLPEGSLRDAINVDIDNSGKPRLREGYKLLYSGINISSLYKNYFKEGSYLKYLNEDNTADILVTGITNKIAYTEFNERIYFTDGVTTGILDGKSSYPLSIPTPAISGIIPINGSVQIAYAYRDITTGEIGGTSIALTDGIAPDLAGHDLIQYKSNGDDGRLFDIAGNLTQTQFVEPMPAGHIIEYYRGKLYIADGSTLWYSQPYRFGLHKPSEDFFNFPERITICIALDNGIFVIADKTYYISFNKNEEANMVAVSQSKAVEGTGLKVPGTDLNLEIEGEVAYWFAEDGATLGLPDGRVQKLTKDVLAVSNNIDKIGASMLSQYNGIKQIISSMPIGGEISNLQSNDTATLIVIRNGVIV